MKKRATPSLKSGDWQPTSKPSPFRPQLRGGVPFPEIRSADDEWSTRWNDPAKGRRVKSVDKRAR